MNLLKIAQHNAANSPSWTANLQYLTNEGYDIFAVCEPPRYATSSPYMIRNTGDNFRVLLAILNPNLIFEVVSVEDYFICIKFTDLNFYVFCVYIPPFSCGRPARKQNVRRVVDTINNFADNALIMGDFNCITSLISDFSCTDGRHIETAIVANEWKILNTKGTFTRFGRVTGLGTAIDWTLISSNFPYDCSWELGVDNSSSDHELISITLNKTVPRSEPCAQFYIHRKQFVSAMGRLTSPQDLPNTLHFMRKLAASIRIKKKVARGSRVLNDPVCTALRRDIKRLGKMINKSLSSKKLALMKERHLITKCLKQRAQTVNTESFNKLVGGTSLKHLNMAWKRLTSEDKKTVDSILVDNVAIVDPFILANTTLDHFFPQCPPPVDLKTLIRHGPQDFPITLHEVIAAFNLQINNVAGSDGINTILIKAWFAKHQQYVVDLFNYWYFNHLFPEELGETMVILIRKVVDNAATLKNVRPIGLTNVIAKVYERVIQTRICHHVEINKLHSPMQYAYRKDVSVNTILHDIHKRRLANNLEDIVISLDVKGAFNNILQHKIIEHLYDLGLPCNIVNFAIEYFDNRYIFLRNCPSVKRKMTRGTTQGTVLGPIFFTLPLNAALDEMKKLFAQVGMCVDIYTFADDITLILKRVKFSTTSLAEFAIQIAQSCLSPLGLSLAVEKTQVMLSSRNPSEPFTLKVKDQLITSVHHCKILGVYFSYNNSFVKHHTYLRGKCLEKMHKVTRLSSYKRISTIKTAEAFARSIIFSTVTFAVHIWWLKRVSLSLKRRINFLDRFMMLSLTGLTINMSYASMHTFRSFPPLLAECMKRKKLIEAQLGLTPNCTFHYPVSLLPHPSSRFPLNFGHDILPGSTIVDFDYIIFSDASRDDNSNVGAAFICFDKNYSATIRRKVKLPSHTSVYQAEQYAIFMAVKAIDKFNLEGSITIASDCLSVLTNLKANCSSDPIHNLIVKHARASRCNITFRWVKAHCGIYGNECADSLAKEALTSPDTSIQLPFSWNHLKRELSKEAHDMWKSMWLDTPTASHIKQFFNDFIDHSKTHIIFNVYNAAIYSGNCYTKVNLAVVSHSSDILCECDNLSPQDVRHVLTECSLFINDNIVNFKGSGLETLIADCQDWDVIAKSTQLREYVDKSAKRICTMLMDRNSSLKHVSNRISLLQPEGDSSSSDSDD